MRYNLILLFLVVIGFFFVYVADADPTIEFIAPTEDNNSIIYVDNTLINTSSVGVNSTALFNWNNSLVGWWRFNEGTGNVVEDFSGYGNNGSFTNGSTGTWTTDGKFGGAWVGDGVNDYVSCGDDESIRPLDEVSVSAWVYLTDDVSGNARRSIVEKGNLYGDSSSYALLWGRQDYSGNQVGFRIGGVSRNDIGYPYTKNTWQHWVGTYDGTNMRLYLDGVLVRGPTASNGALNSQVKPLYFMKWELYGYTPGMLDEVQIYNRVLSPDEINASYDAGANGLFNTFTGLNYGTYNYMAYVQDENGNVNSTETRYLTIEEVDPTIEFIAPTEANNSVIYVNNTLINTSASDANNDNITSFLNWNNSLVGWWRMNEGTGNVAEDFSGYGNNGSFTDGVTGNWTTDGVFGDAWVGDSVNDFVNCGNDPSLDITTAITLEGWIKPNALGVNQPIISKPYATDGARYLIGIGNNNKIKTFFTYTTTFTGNTIIEQDVWSHVAVTWNGSTVALYLNGEYDGGGLLASPIGSSPTSSVLIGRSGGATWTNNFNGPIDEVRIHNRGLSPDEIKSSYNASVHRLFNNFTDLVDGTYNYIAYIQDENGNVNSTETRYLTIATPPVITLLSQTPETMYENSSGIMTQVWGISHVEAGLDEPSVAYTFGMYNVVDDIYKFNLRTPSNNLADLCAYCGKNILRGINRNQSLTWENNTDITGGDIYTWNGYDYYDTEITFQVVNDTYTNVTVTGFIRNQVFPFSTYLDDSDLKAAPKTVFPIHKTSGLVVKLCDNEAFLNHEHLGFAYVDAIITGTPPTDATPIELFYLNESFDPDGAVHPDDSLYLFYLTSMNASEWATNDYSPHLNSSYVNSIVVNSSAIENAGINVTGIAYLYFRSSTPSARPYGINMTNVASSTNVSFADSKTMWKTVSTPFSITVQDYTPNIFTSFMHVNIQYQSKLWIQSNNTAWANSSLETTNIEVSIFPPSVPGFDYICFGGVHDYDMDNAYYGDIGVGIGVSHDPDGGAVSHNLTLHYDNGTFVAVINNTFTDEDANGGGFICVDFNTTPYYSDDVEYTMKINATDDDGDSVVQWLGVSFQLTDTPVIIDYNPATATSTTEEFNITINQDVDVIWYIDGVEVFNESGVNTSSYNDTYPSGIYNVTAYVENVNGSDQHTWVWNIPYVNVVPVQLFLLLLFGLCICSVGTIGGMHHREQLIEGLIFNVIGLMISSTLAVTCINAHLVEVYGYVSSTDTIATGFNVIQSSAMSWMFSFLTLVIFGALIYNLGTFISEQLKPVLEEESL